MDSRELAYLLGKKPRQCGDGGWLTNCPAHEDRTPSLSIREGQRQPIVLHCFAGCSFQAVAGAIEGLGIQWSDRPAHYSPRPRKKRPRQYRPTERAVYAGPSPIPPMPEWLSLQGWMGPKEKYGYRNEAGEFVFIVCRYQNERKQETHRAWSRWRDHFFATPKWACRQMPSPRILYRADVLGTSKKPKLILEGEKTAKRAIRLFPDLEPTTAAGGVNGWRHAQLEPLGRNPDELKIIFPDNDKGGRKNAQEMANHLRKEFGCHKVAIVDISREWPRYIEEAWPRSRGWDVADLEPADDLEKWRKALPPEHPLHLTKSCRI